MPPTKYKPVLAKLMSHFDGVTYGNEYEHSTERLGNLTPEDLLLWFHHKCFDTSTPGAAP